MIRKADRGPFYFHRRRWWKTKEGQDVLDRASSNEVRSGPEGFEGQDAEDGDRQLGEDADHPRRKGLLGPVVLHGPAAHPCTGEPSVRPGIGDDFVVRQESEQLDKMDVENHYEFKKQEDCKGAPTPGTTATGHQREEAALEVHPDWYGIKCACKGNMKWYGSHPEDSCSVTRNTDASSTGMAELKALNRSAASTTVTTQMTEIRRLGMEVKRRGFFDSVVGQDMVQQRRSGKGRHLEGQGRGLPEVRRVELEVVKIGTG